MTDTLSTIERSQLMARVRNKNTRPEMIVRRMVHGAGYRYRLHSEKLLGKPDLVFLGRRKVIFVHGCFWHRHSNCSLARIPKSNQDFWLKKLEGNRKRDDRIMAELQKTGWGVLVVWECELRNPDELLARVRAFLDQTID